RRLRVVTAAACSPPAPTRPAHSCGNTPRPRRRRAPGSTVDPARPEHAQECTPGAAFHSRTGQPGSPAHPTRQNGSQGRAQEGMTMNDQTTDALNQVTEQLARIAAAIEAGTAHTPRHAAEPDD